ncbi:MAG TPA: ACT domain-containing protein [Verrucomicrobiae bacterium]|nr:ACT domain-containing protein [Verrucomicrobiae bacterium]
MQSQLVLTVIGKDRPGLVEALAATVADHGGNWLESRMCHLGGDFAGILRVEVPAADAEALSAALAKLEAKGLQVVVRPDHEAAAPATASATIEIIGQDRPGIVKQISKTLASHQVNVEELHTERSSAPMSGEMLFQARLEVLVPAGGDMAALRQSLERIAADLMVEINFKEPV